MSGRLVGEVVDWLLTPAAADLTLAERIALLVIADRSNDDTREMWRFKVDDITLAERIQGAAGIDATGLRHALQRLRKRGLEVRVPVKHGKDGRPVYAFKGSAMRFRLPPLPASVELPQRGPDEAASPVENPVDNTPPGDPERGPGEAPSSAKGGLRKAQRGPDEAPLRPMYPYEELPYKDSGSSPYVAEEEGTPPVAATPPAKASHPMGWDPDYREASDFLFALANEGQEFMEAAAKDLGDAPIADRVIHAARLAKGGIAA